MGLRQRLSGFFRASDADGNPAIRNAERRSDLTKPSEEFLAALGGSPTAAGTRVTPDTGKAIAAAYACVDLRSRVLASLPLKLYQKTPRGRVEVPTHPAARLFSIRPNGAQTRASFIAWMQANIDTRGNAVAPVVRDGMYQPVALLPLAPGEIDPMLTVSGDILYRHAGRTLTRADLLHIPGNDLRASDGIWGVSPITRLRETFGLAMATQQQAARFMANDATPPLVLKNTLGKFDQKQAENLSKQWAAAYGGKNRGNPAVTPWGVEPMQLGFNAQDTQLLESRAFDVDEVARIYGVPGELIGAKGASSWGTGIGEKIQGFVKFTIQAICTQWEQALDWTLLTEDEKDSGYYFAFTLDALLRGDLAARAAIYKTLREIAVMDVNQIRELEDWVQYPDAWAGDPRQPLNNQGGRNEPAATEAIP